MVINSLTTGRAPPSLVILWNPGNGKIVSISGEYLKWIPSGKRLHSYGKSPFLMGKLTINCHFQ